MNKKKRTVRLGSLWRAFYRSPASRVSRDPNDPAKVINTPGFIPLDMPVRRTREEAVTDMRSLPTGIPAEDRWIEERVYIGEDAKDQYEADLQAVSFGRQLMELGGLPVP